MHMEIDPHTIQEIVTKIREQLRCPQCRKRVEVDFDALKVVGGDFAVLQLKCHTCDAYIMLYASINAQKEDLSSPQIEKSGAQKNSTKSTSKTKASGSTETSLNFSTKLITSTDDLETLRKSLEEAGGSFSELFENSN